MLIRTGAGDTVGIQHPTPSVLHSSTDLRVVLFNLMPGQAVPPHSSHSTVMLVVLSGHGTLQNGDVEFAAGPGDLVIVEPFCRHSMAAGEEPMVILSAIAPCP